jgi:hypothetical protein
MNEVTTHASTMDSALDDPNQEWADGYGHRYVYVPALGIYRPRPMPPAETGDDALAPGKHP